MHYQEWLPHPRLRGVAECLWTIRSAPERGVLPDGCMDLIWTGTALVVAGPDTTSHAGTNGGAATGLRFAPGRLPALLDVPAAALRDQRVPLGELHRTLAGGATARLEAGEAPQDVLTDLAVALPGSPAPRWLDAVVAAAGSGTSAADIAVAVGWTPRSLHRQCLTSFGYGPATLRRVLRFRRAVAMLHAGVPIAETAARAGYADQPHLSREVRSLSGQAPGQLASGANRSTPVPSGSRTVA